MKIGKLTKTNTKGQFVIPQEYRELYGISPDVFLNIIPKSTGIFIQPVSKVVPQVPTDDVYLNVLSRAKGSWKGDDLDQTSKKRRKTELSASKRRKTSW